MDKLTISLIGRNNQKDIHIRQALQGWASIKVYIDSDSKNLIDKLEEDQAHIILLSIDVDDLILDKVIEKFGKRTILIANDNIYETERIVRAIQLGAAQYVNIHPHEEVDGHLLQTKINRVAPYKKMRQAEMNHSTVMKKTPILMEPFPATSMPQLDYPSIQTIIAIGTSTGGPRALEVVIRNLPEKLSVPILVVQHMPERFTKSLANRLNRIHPGIHVKEAEHLEVLEAGTVYIAPGNYHMEVRKKHRHFLIHIHQDHFNSPHRPSVDVLFQSISLLTSVNKVAVILTGMGKDGSEGIRHMKTNDAHTIVIVESKETVVVNGMTSAAIATNLVNEIVPIEQVSKTIWKYMM